MEDLVKINQALTGKTAEEVLRWALGHFGAEHVALAASLGAEDQALTDLLHRIAPKAEIFTLDTGRLPKETYDCMKRTEEKYGFKYRIYHPDPVVLKKMVEEKGPDLFYESVGNRKLCCHVRKVEPLRRALQGKRAWICGLRREQSVTRTGTELVEWDGTNELYKINPLIGWNDKEVWEYLRGHQIPYNRLHDQGYPSIGCAPCTRAVAPGEDPRAGRWWWEHSEKKECGLHFRDGKVVREGT